MECGEQCVVVTGITVMPELCVDNWGTMSTLVKVSQLVQISDIGVRCYLQ